MRKLLSLIIPLLAITLFLSATPKPSHAACCPTSDISCNLPYQCPGIDLACDTLAECPSNTICGEAKVTPSDDGYHWDIRYCVGSPSRQTIADITSAEGICRQAPEGYFGEVGRLVDRQNLACHEDNHPIFSTANLAPATYSQTFENLIIGQDPNTNMYFTCFNFLRTDRNVGVVEINLKNSSNKIVCSSRVNVSPGGYGFWESLDNTLETRGGDIGKLLGGLITDPTERDSGTLKCETVTGKKGINTAFGCIATDPVGFTQDFLTIAIGVGGSIALLLLLYAAILIALSQGNPQKIQSGQQIIAAVIQGLILITLSVVMLNFLGINILNLPGLQ